LVHSQIESRGGLQQQKSENLFVEKRRERLNEIMQWDPETSGSMDQIGSWVFVAIFYCLRVEMSLRCKQIFPGKEKCLLGQFLPFGISFSLPFIPIHLYLYFCPW
jgi:hypothetical protein